MSWTRIFLEKLIFAQIFKKFCCFYEIWRSINIKNSIDIQVANTGMTTSETVKIMNIQKFAFQNQNFLS